MSRHAVWHRLYPVLVVLSTLVAEVHAQAADPALVSDGGSGKQILSAPRTILDQAAARGFSFQLSFVNDWSKVPDRDKDADGGFGRYSLDLSLTVDGAKTIGWSGTTAFIRLKNHINEFGDTYDDEAQLYSNIDGISRTTLYELWMEHKLLPWLQVKGGKMDASADFASVATGTDFLNSSMGFSPTIMSFPSYPEPQPGIAAFFQPSEKYTAKVAAFRTTNAGTLTLIEPGYAWSRGVNGLPGHINAGYWRLFASLPNFRSEVSSFSQGYYLVSEQSLWQQNLRNKAVRDVSGFLQLGHGNAAVSPITDHVGTGLVLRAPFEQRSKDAVGMGATWVRFSDDPVAGYDRNAELIPESYYKFSLTNKVAVVEDFQLLHHPGGMKAYEDCPVITSRLAISF